MQSAAAFIQSDLQSIQAIYGKNGMSTQFAVFRAKFDMLIFLKNKKVGKSTVLVFYIKVTFVKLALLIFSSFGKKS